MTDSSAQTTVPFYRDVKKLAVIAQVVFLVVVIALIALVINNINTGLKKQNLNFTFDFLSQTAGFSIAEGTAFGVPYDASSDNFYKVIALGLYNTLRVAITGMVLATLLGVVMGIARLSSNWLVNRIALVYVEILRNTPVLVQLFVWYFVVVLALPPISGVQPILGTYLSNSGLAMPWLVQRPDAPNFFPVWVVAFFMGVAVFTFFSRQRARTGKPTPAGPFGLMAWLAVVLIGYFALGQPLEYGAPQRTNFGVSGGLQVSPEFTALLVGLVVYTSAFIAEITRAGIQAVHKGQWEASRALGLGYSETLQLIILPQALRVMIPPLGNQYLNLTKNSSLAIAIGYSDLFNVLGTAGNQSGQNLQTFTIAGLIYLVLSFIIAGIVNLYNTATRLRTR
ncbi:MAG: ABC transporter permease subunit [Pleurocapsa sp. SU_196_0]|nr:ABC transporter permease subunit [Pleurocapsa sp. SU_196_0]